MTPEIPPDNLEQAKQAVESLDAVFRPLVTKLPANTEMSILFRPEGAE